MQRAGFPHGLPSIYPFNSQSPPPPLPESVLALRRNRDPPPPPSQKNQRFPASAVSPWALRCAVGVGRRGPEEGPAKAEAEPLHGRIQPPGAGAAEAGGAAGPHRAGPGRAPHAGRGARPGRVRGHLPLHGGRHGGPDGLQVHLQVQAQDPRRHRGHAPGGGDHAPHAAAPKHRQLQCSLRGRRRRAPRHGAMRGRRALQHDHSQGTLHRVPRRGRHTHHRRGRPDVPQEWRHPSGP